MGEPARQIETPWLNYAEAAQYTRKSVRTLRRLVGERSIPYYGTPRGRLFRRDMLDLWNTNPSLAMRKWNQEIADGRPKTR